MMMSKQVVSLLEYLSLKVNCMYLSDLRYLRPAEFCKLVRVVQKLPADAFSVREWQDAMEYLFGIRKTGENAEELKAAMLQALEDRIQAE